METPKKSLKENTTPLLGASATMAAGGWQHLKTVKVLNMVSDKDNTLVMKIVNNALWDVMTPKGEAIYAPLSTEL